MARTLGAQLKLHACAEEVPNGDAKGEKRKIEDLDIDEFLAGDFLDSDMEADEGGQGAESESEDDLEPGSDEEDEEEEELAAAAAAGEEGEWRSWVGGQAERVTNWVGGAASPRWRVT